MPERRFNVLFLCTANSARSIMAEAILARDGGDGFAAFSAGSHPRGTVNPTALTVLEGLGYDIGRFRSKAWDEFAAPGAPVMDFVFTVCDQAAGETCPLWPGQPMTAHWGIPDPAAAVGSAAEVAVAFRDAYRMLERRISLFVALPIESIERLALQKRLDSIGGHGPAPQDTADTGAR